MNTRKQNDEQLNKTTAFSQAMSWGDLMGKQCDNGDFEEALKSSKKAIELKGESYLPYIYYNTGNIYLGLKKYLTAIKWYDKAINEFKGLYKCHTKEEGDYLCNKGVALFRLNKFEQAEPILLQSIEANPNNEEPYLFLSEIYKLTNRQSESKKMHKKYETRRLRREKIAI